MSSLASLILLALPAWSPAPLPQGPTPTAVEVALVREAEAARTLEVLGEVRAEVHTRLGVAVGGIVKDVFVKEGDKVALGAELAQMDTEPFAAAVELASAAVAIAQAEKLRLERRYSAAELEEAQARVRLRKAELDAAERELKRQRSLMGRGHTSELDLDNAQATFDAAEARHEEATQAKKVLEEGTRPEEIAVQDAIVRERKARLRRSQWDLDRATIKAPFEGYVIRRMLQKGEWTSPGTAAFEMYDPNELRIHARVPEEETARLIIGRQARFSVDAYPDSSVGGGTFTAVVERVVPWIDPGSRSFPVRFTIVQEEAPQPFLRPGMSVRLMLELSDVKKGLSIPRDAVFHEAEADEEDPERRRTFVWVEKSNVVSKAYVRIIGSQARRPGERLDRYVCSEGPPSGSRVIVIGGERLRAGAKVQVLSRRN